MQRVAATQAKVAVRAAQEKKARAIADVWAAIATRKRSREQDCGETKEAEPRATQHRQDDGTEMTTEGPADVRGKQEKVVRPANGWAATAERKRKNEQESTQAQEAPPRAKQRKEDHGTERTLDTDAEMSCRQQKNACATEKVTLVANEANATRKSQSFEYVCPACQKCVRSSIRTGQVNHERTCGNRFRVKDAQVVTKAYACICPACKGNVASDVKTGKIDHRTVCVNQFSVKDGLVNEKAYVYICPGCKGNVASDVKTGKIDHRTVCGTQFSVKEGVVKEKAYVYICPACKGNVASDVKTGRVNHQTVCGKKFWVKDGVVQEKGDKRHA